MLDLAERLEHWWEIADIDHAFLDHTKITTKQHYLKSYLIAINDKPVFTLLDIHQEVSFYQNYDKPPDILTLILDPE